MVPSPVLYFAAKHLKIASAVMLTGSHNPPDYNGLKIIIDSVTIYGAAIQELYQTITAQNFAQGKGNYATANIIADYIAAVQHSVKLDKQLTVVVDCGNGIPGAVMPELLEKLGCNVIPLYCEVDGNFPNHHPDPSDPHNLIMLRETVVKTNADIGLAFDGDGDRLGVMDNNGKIIWPDRALMLFAQEILARKPGATIIYDVKCSRDVEAIIKQAGGVPLMWKTGHSLIKAKMRETGAELAAEMSGHVFFQDRWYGFDDALYTAARLLEILSQYKETSAAVFAQLPEAVSTPELNVDVTEASKFAIMDALLQNAKFDQPHKIVSIDGMRVEFDNGWGLLRPSNTTPKLVARFEAATSDALDNIKQQFRNALLNIDPELSIPF
jgi:phosphomannomutase/phosphoglucomutase